MPGAAGASASSSAINSAAAAVTVLPNGVGAHEDSQLAGLGREFEVGNPAWRQQPQLLAPGKNPGAAAGTVECVVEDARFGQRSRLVLQGPGLSSRL